MSICDPPILKTYHFPPRESSNKAGNVAMLWIRVRILGKADPNDFKTDPDPTFYLNVDPDVEPNQCGSMRTEYFLNYSFVLGLDPRSTTLVGYRYCVSVVYLGATWNVS